MDLLLHTSFMEDTVYGENKYVSSLVWKETACKHSLHHSSYKGFFHHFRSFCFLNFLVIGSIALEDILEYSTKFSTLI